MWCFLLDLSSCVLCARLHVCCVACVLGFALNLSSAGARGCVAPAGPSLRVHQSQDFPVRIVTRPSATSGQGIEECLCEGTLGPEQGKGVVADLWGFCFCVSLFLPPFVQVCFFLPACVLGLCVVWDCLFAIVGVFVCSFVVAYVF